MSETVRSFRGGTVLVTGASGFIGAHLCRRLVADGATVHGAYRTAPAAGAEGVRWRQADMSDAAAVGRLVAEIGPDVVFHLAGFVSGSRGLDAVAPGLESGLVATVNLLTAATETGCRRIVLAGSLEEPAPGDWPPIPASPYAAAKFAGSAYARMFHALYGTPVVMTRIFMVYGPGQRDLRKLVPYVTLSLLRGEAPELSSGERLVDWIYVEDVVEGLLAAAASAEAVGSTVDLGSGRFFSVRDVALTLSAIIDSGVQPAFGSIADRPMEQVRLADVADTAARIGWAASTPIETGLRRTVEWYAEGLRAGAFAAASS